MAERQRLQLALGEDRLPLFQMPHGAPDNLQRRGDRRKDDRLPGARHGRNRGQTHPSRPLGPIGLQHRPHWLRLALARCVRRDLRRALAVGQVLLLEVVQNLASARRECIAEFLVVARDLEALYPARHRGQNRIALLHQPPRQLVPVIRPDQPRVAVQRDRLDALPPALRIPGHVGDHRMGVQLRVQVAARDMAEGRRHHRRRLDPGPPAGGRVPPPGLQHRVLDPVEGRAHRLVMRAHHAPVAARMLLRRQQRRERYRFGGREGDVETRPMLVLSVTEAPQPYIRSEHMALEQLVELPRPDLLAGLQPKGTRAAPVPGAAVPVLGLLRLLQRPVVVLQIIAAILLEVFGSGGGRGQIADSGDHDAGS